MDAKQDAQKRWRMKYRDSHLAAGICVRCPKPARPGKQLCVDCTAQVRAYQIANQARYTALQKAKREAHRAAGLCINCNEPAVVGQRKCLEHTAADRIAHARYRDKLAAKALGGTCLYCTRPAVKDRSMCEPHLIKNRDAHRLFRKRRRDGVAKRSYLPRAGFIGPIQERPELQRDKPPLPVRPVGISPPAAQKPVQVILCACGKRPPMRGGTQCFGCARLERGAA